MSPRAPTLAEERRSLERLRAIGDVLSDEGRAAPLGVADYLIVSGAQVQRLTLGELIVDGQHVSRVDVQLAGPAFREPSPRMPTPAEGVAMVANLPDRLRPLLARVLLESAR